VIVSTELFHDGTTKTKKEQGEMTGNTSGRKPWRMAVLVAGASALLVAMFSAATAQAALHFESIGVRVSEPNDPARLNNDGTFATPPFSRQAGAHPDLTVDFSLTSDGSSPPPEGVRTVDVDLPVGFVGNPTEVATCDPADLANDGEGGSNCPPEAQVGVVDLKVLPQQGRVALYNLAHGPNVAARMGFNITNVTGIITARVRPGDYGISSGSFAISQGAPVQKARVTIWGIPADPIHDLTRLKQPFGQIGGNLYSPGFSFFTTSTSAPQVPFLTAPTSCQEPDQPLSFEVRGDSWEHPGVFDTRVLTEDMEGNPFAFEGCHRLSFDPAISVNTTSHATDVPSGLSVDLKVPQGNDSTGLATAHVRDVRMTLPKGMTISASSADGLGACSSAQIGLGSANAPICPDSSKLGTVRIDTPVLDEELQGDVILAKQNENPFNSLLALYIAVKGPGFWLKLPGKVEPDPDTGQLTVSFKDNPQLPFNRLLLDLKNGPRAPLTTPSKCGTYKMQTVLTPWSGTDPVELNTPITIDQGCNTGRFSPGFKAGTVDPTAGFFSPFVMQITRADGDQNLAKLTAALPEGLLAKLAGVAICGDPQAATGECPTASQVGKVTVGAGSGPNPVFVPEAGKTPTAAYLAGPYKGAPYSLVVKVPAQAGPFDLGTVAVRNALNIDPTTTQVTAVSDPLPQILEGIPIAYRDLRVEVDRPQFIVNPTSCEAKKILATIGGSEGASASPTAPFAAVNCERLGFKPKLALKFTGPTHRSAYPALKATLTMPKSGANIGKAVVTLPKTEFLENAHIGTICTRVQYAADQCPAKSVYGYARAWSPLLDKPLQGPVYLRSSNHILPDLVASLDGEIDVDLAGRIDSPGGRIRNTFWAVPDAPVSKFVLTMKGGDKGLLVNNTELCRARPRSRAEFIGQNGKRSISNPRVKLSCAGRKKR
jgi:hypothetical protein